MHGPASGSAWHWHPNGTLRRSRSHPERGVVQLDLDIRNQNGEPVMSMRLANLIELRDPSAPMIEGENP